MSSPTPASTSSSAQASQQIVSIQSVDPTNNTATGLTRQSQTITIDTRYHVGAVHVVPGVGEQWYIQKVGTVSWALNRKLPANTTVLTNVVDNPVAGQVSIGSSGIVSGPLNLMGSVVSAQAPLKLSSSSASTRPSASDSGAGALIWDTDTSKALISDGTSWNSLT